MMFARSVAKTGGLAAKHFWAIARDLAFCYNAHMKNYITALLAAAGFAMSGLAEPM